MCGEETADENAARAEETDLNGYASDSGLDKDQARTTSSPSARNVIVKATSVFILLALTAASVALWSTTGPLPLSYFLLVSGAMAVLLTEIMMLPDFGTKESLIALLQLTTILAFSKFSETFRFASILGYDTYVHRGVLRTILQTQHLNLTLGTSSAAFPALDLFLAELLHVGAIDEKAAFAITAMLGIIAILVFFLIARLFLSPRWAMVAAVVLSAAPFFKWWTEVEVSPTTIGILLAFLTTYAFFRGTQHRRVSLWIFGGVAMAGLVISHPILTLFALWILLCLGVAQFALRRRVRAPSVIGSAALMAIVTLTYWMYLSGAWVISVSLFYSVLTAGVGYTPLRPALGPSDAERFLGDMPWAILVLGALFSGVRWVRPPARNPLKTGWAFMTAGMSALSGFSSTGGGLVAAFTNRWLLLLEIAAAILFANSIRALVSGRNRRWAVLAVAITTALIASSAVSPVASLYRGHNPLLAFSEGELKAMAFGAKCTSPIVTDSYSATYLHFTYHRPTADLYGYSIGVRPTFTSACILLQSESNVVFTKTSRGTLGLTVDNADFAPGTAEIPVDFKSLLASEWGVERTYDNGDAIWYYRAG